MPDLISILIPCRNEERYIEACLNSILQFGIPEGVTIELLVLDGMSTDRTREIAELVRKRNSCIRIISNPGKIQSCAMNIGIREAKGNWIMRLDAHTRYAPDYLLLCFETSRRTNAANVGGICITQAGGAGYQASVVQALTTCRFGVGNSGFRTGSPEGYTDTVPFGFFDRSLFQKVGLFDERLLRAQDYEFNRRIIASGRKIWINPKIQSFYYNQPTLLLFYKKQFVYEAPYNAYLWFLAPYAFAWRHAITAVFALGVIGGVCLSWWISWICIAFAAVLTLYFVFAVCAAIQQAVRFRKVLHSIMLPPCFFAYHFLHGLGVWVGIFRLALKTAPVCVGKPWDGANQNRPWPLDPESTTI